MKKIKPVNKQEHKNIKKAVKGIKIGGGILIPAAATYKYIKEHPDEVKKLKKSLLTFIKKK